MRKGVVCVLICVAAFSLGACTAGKQEKKSPPVPVVVATAEQKAVPVQVQAMGTVEASESISLKSQVAGQIRKILFTEGQDVRRGDLLVQLDSRASEAALGEALAVLAKDRAQAAHAREQARRYAELVKRDYVSREQADQTAADAASLDAAVKADEAQVENARVQLQYCSIHAPISGRVGRKLVDEGNIVSAGSTEITLINRIEPVSVTFSVPEKTLPQVKAAMARDRKLQVNAFIPGSEAGPEQGELSFVDNAIDRTTGTITLKGTFDNRGKLLWPGQYVDVAVTLGIIPDAVVVPARAVEQGPEGQYVYVVKKDRTVDMRTVVPGQALKEVTVIASGLAPGETVVTDGQLRLVPGARVAVKGPEGKGAAK